MSKALRATICSILLCAMLLGGGVAHGDWFGDQTAGGTAIEIENDQAGTKWDDTQGKPTADGTADSITVYLRAGGADPPNFYTCRCALYEYDSLSAANGSKGHLVDSTLAFNLTSGVSDVDAWYSLPLQLNASMVSTKKYMPVCWGKNGFGAMYMFLNASSGDTVITKALLFSQIWPSTQEFANSSNFTMSIYVTYTIPSTGIPGKRRIEQQRIIRGSIWKQAQQTFAGSMRHAIEN